jgi:quinol monooxygenase YgiN
MSDYVGWRIELLVHPGQLDAWKALMLEMVESTRAERGTLTYEWTLGDDGRVSHIDERYVDAAAALVHARTFAAKFARRFFELSVATRVTVTGTPNAELRATFGDPAPTYLAPLGGFRR